MSFPTDTIAAPATPVGTSALALVRASGPEVRALAGAIFGGAPLPRQAQHADYRDVGGTLVDDVVYTYFAAPHSFTGEDTLEIACHGNPYIVQRVLEDLLARGCRAAEAGEFSKRAYLNGRMDLSQAEAVIDLIHARGERALAMANQQLRGVLGRQMEKLVAQLVSVLAVVEAYIDFPDEDLPPEDRRAVLAQLGELRADTGRLLATSHYGAMLRDGVRTVILGEPNAGKSSLLNRLVGRDRALVSAEPGTTRDYLEERIMAGPYALRLVDTAGLNPAPTALERRGMDKTLEQAADADIFLWVLDATRPWPMLPAHVRARLTADNTVVVVNKVDLGEPSQPAPVGFPAVKVSAVTGAGLEELRRQIVRLADAFQTQVGSDLIAVSARHADALARSQRSLEAAERGLRDGISSELVASELREAMDGLGEIAGRIDNEQVLDRIFASFCIGK